jgi:hypothetical protein
MEEAMHFAGKRERFLADTAENDCELLLENDGFGLTAGSYYKTI